MKKLMIAALAAAMCAGAFAKGPEKPRKAPDRFRIGFAGYTFCSYQKHDLDAALKVLQKLDVHDLCVKDFWLPLDASDAQMKAFKEKCAKYGVTGYGVGPIYMRDNKTVDQAFDYARRLGVNIIVGVPCEPGPNGKGNVQSLVRCRYVAQKLKEARASGWDVKYAVHNHGPDMPNNFPKGETVYNMVKDLDPNFGLCLDLGHEFRFGSSPADTIRRFGDRIFDVHIKDEPVANRTGRCVPLGTGLMDFVDILAALREVRYAGSLSIEYERDMKEPLLGIGESIGALKTYIYLTAPAR